MTRPFSFVSRALFALPLSAVLALASSSISFAAPSPSVPKPAGKSLPPIPTSKGVVDAIVLKQTSTFVGNVEMTVSDSGIRFSMSKMGLVWMTFPPKWDGIAFNPESKSYLVRPHSEWKKKLFNLPTGKKTEELARYTVKETGKKEMIEGYLCRKEALMSVPSKKRKPGEPSKPYVAGNIWVADSFPAPKEVGELMTNFVKVEVKKGIVLKAEMLKPNSFTEFKPVFETMKITKKKVPASVFDAPKNYKLVTSELQLMMGDSDSPDPSMGGSGMSGMGSESTEALLKKLKSQ
ncbi:MAG: hypothetical protein JSS83_21220 [Cyanobacteria bacterium SZAS LIN-3]|nr:hypothetical protein [Cyanobacteria bacterium SZAS LIN-3]